jgi:hypothetical protein
MFLQTSPTRLSHQPAAMVMDMNVVPESIPVKHFTHHQYAPLLDSDPYPPHHSCAVCSAGTSSALDLHKFYAGPQFAPACEVSLKSTCIYTKIMKLTEIPPFKVCPCLTSSFNDLQANKLRLSQFKIILSLVLKSAGPQRSLKWRSHCNLGYHQH